MSYANAAATEIEFWSGCQNHGSTLVRRPGLNSRTLTPPVDGGRGGRGGGAGQNAGGWHAGAARRADDHAPTPRRSARCSQPVPTRRLPRRVRAACGAPVEGATGDTGGGFFGNAPPPIPPKTFDLSTAYSIDGWFGDTFVDLIPDRLETAIVIGDGADSLGAAHIAARLGLEATGVTLPLARNARKVTNAAGEAEPDSRRPLQRLIVQQLVKLGKVRLDDLKPGEGAIQIVPKAFGAPTRHRAWPARTPPAPMRPRSTSRGACRICGMSTRGSFRLERSDDAGRRFLRGENRRRARGLALREIDDVLQASRGQDGRIVRGEDLPRSEEPGPRISSVADRITDAIQDRRP